MVNWKWGALIVAVIAASHGGAAGEAVRDTGKERRQPERPTGATSLRLTVRGGTVSVKVTDFDAARQGVLGAAHQHGAELLNSHTQVNFQGKKHGWLRFRIAADRWPELLAQVRGVGKLYAENTTAADHASEYEELQRRVDRLHEHQQRLAAVLQSRRRLRGSDILYLQERLFRAGVDEGMLRQRRVDLERSSRVSTLVVELFEPEPRRTMDLGNWYAGAALRARSDLYRQLARALTAGTYTLVFAPFWIPGLLIVWLLGRWLWRRSRLVGMRLLALVTLLANMISNHRAAGLPRSEL